MHSCQNAVALHIIAPRCRPIHNWPPRMGFSGTSSEFQFCAGCGDITTRANVQLRGITLAEADKVFAGLQTVGLSSVSTGVWACCPT